MPHPTLLRRMALPCLLCTAAGTAHAAFITFDERPRTTEDTSWYADPITDEYDALGVRIGDGYLQTPDYWGNTQSLLGGPGFHIDFVGTLPTYVSFDFTTTSWPNGQSLVTASGPDGPLGSFSTGGYYWGDPSLGLIWSPFEFNSHASFHSATGISSLSFGSAFNSRNIGWIDNLYFGTVPPVPEPGSMALMAAGLGVLGWTARRRRLG